MVERDLDTANRGQLQTEFSRAATGFSERTKGRFDDMDVLSFARFKPFETVVEVGAGTGNFLALFAGASLALGIDAVPRMLAQARIAYPDLSAAVGDGHCLPLASDSFDLVACAQMLHHVHKPLEILEEMKRVMRPSGRLLVIDQVASDRFEEAVAMNELDILRDPSHASSRPASAFRILFNSAGLSVVDERRWEGNQRLSQWMWPGEFPEERIRRVRDFIVNRGGDTGMGWRPDADDWVYTRRRIMLLATKD
ncbi:MAG: methyltransferase domain-containing protein [Actinomycetota bacterium]|nr:methyltransferase domain-containing protein [Actinomycetota bacterium]